MAENGAVEMSPHKGDVKHSGEEVSGAYPQAQSVRGLDRYITLKPAVGFALTTQSSWIVIGFSVGAALLNGGPTAMVYGTILVTLGTLTIAASIGELASINPVVGAQYRWTALYSPGIMRPEFWGLMQGWLTVFSWIFLCGGAPFICALVIQGLIVFNDETYVPERWHGTLLAWAYLLVPFTLNVYGRKLLKTIEIVGGIFYIIFFITTIVTLIVMAPRNPSEFVFKESFFGQSGWENEGVQWCLGLLTITAVLIGFDGVIHLAAEVTDAPRKVPKAMMLSVGLNGILSFGYIIAILYTIGDITEVVETPTGIPIVQIYYQATGSRGGAITLVCMLLVAGTISIFGLFASTSRLTWAFANDRGLPFASFFSHVNPTLRIPLNALILVTVVSALLALINLGSTQALYAVLSLSTMGLYISYLLPILFILIRKLKGQHPVYGPFRLGRFGIPINIIALLYGIFIVIFLPFPILLPVTAADMNYAGPILGGVLLLALVDYFTGGKNRFILPKSDAEYIN